MKQYKCYDFVMAAFVCIMLCSNIIGASKVFVIGGFSFGAGIIFFPISYIFGDVLTEVYGYARARRVVWAGFASMIFASFVSWLVVSLPPAEGWPNQAAFEIAFGSTWRITMGSLIAFTFGEFCNSYVLAKMKVFTQGKHLWSRFVGSTIIGEGVDSLIFYPVAFFGIWPTALVFKVLLSSYVLKVLWEIAVMPFTYIFVNWLKRVEQEDYFDYKTDFNPFKLKVER
ncbi:MAG: queuosine precursor transporter [Bdellovibrionales bacterium]